MHFCLAYFFTLFFLSNVEIEKVIIVNEENSGLESVTENHVNSLIECMPGVERPSSVLAGQWNMISWRPLQETI
jgi:hypothetical protein